MSSRFEELDWSSTPFGEMVLRRRREPVLGLDVYEVKMDDEFLMSSLFTVAEVELARLGLAALAGSRLSVMVGGLGLGYTARSALEDPRVDSVVVVEAVEPVVDWHRRRLLPETAGIADDPRCTLVHGDFFEMVAADTGPRHDAVLLDIDHSPRNVLRPEHESFYTQAGLRALTSRLTAGGVFALWSDDRPDHEFESALAQVLGDCETHVVTFANPLTGGESANTVYVGRRISEPDE